MRTPSRFMPKCSPKPIGLWVVLLAPLLLITFIASIVLSPVLNVETQKRRVRLKKIKDGRGGCSICEFARYFNYREIDTWVIRAVYEQLQEYLDADIKDFPVHPKDDIFEELEIDDEEFEFVIVGEIAERTGRSLDDIEKNSYFGKVNIVENLVYLLNEQPKIT